MRDSFSRELYEAAKRDPRVMIVVADISPAGSMLKFREEFPERFINVGVAEQSMIGICAGLALRGFRPFAYSIATFSLYRPFEQIRDDLCYQNLPVTVVGIGAGLTYSTLGGTHHAQEDIAIMRSLPNMAIIAPCDPHEVEFAVNACLKRQGPTYLRLGKVGEPNLTAEAIDPFEFGKIRTIKAGDDCAIVSYGPILKMAFEAANHLEAMGCSTAIYSTHTLKPFDKIGLAKLFFNYECVITLEEHSEINGLADISKRVAWETQSTARLLTFSLKDEFIHLFGTHAELLAAHGLSVKTIVSQYHETSRVAS